MPGRGGYDRGFGYDRGYRGRPAGYNGGERGRPAGYDRGFARGRYDASYAAGGIGPDYGPPIPFPFVPFGYDPMMGPMAWSVPPAYGPPMAGGYDRGYRVPPRRSPTYGRGGDRALRAWADRYGYDVEYSIPPRPWPRR